MFLGSAILIVQGLLDDSPYGIRNGNYPLHKIAHMFPPSVLLVVLEMIFDQCIIGYKIFLLSLLEKISLNLKLMSKKSALCIDCLIVW